MTGDNFDTPAGVNLWEREAAKDKHEELITYMLGRKARVCHKVANQETGGGEGSKQLTKMSSSNATPWVNEGRSRKGKGRKWNTNLTIKDVDDTQS